MDGGSRQMKRTRRSTGTYLATLTARSFVFACLVLAIQVFSAAVQAQVPDDLDEGLPPPLRVMSKDEKARLDLDREIKSRTKLALEFMTSRLAAAEKELSASNFDEMMANLGGFEALLDNHLEFMTRNDNDSGRVLDNFKRFEIGLRSFIPRIETIRRELPDRFERLVRNVGKYLREARTRALEPMFSDTVLRQPKRPN